MSHRNLLALSLVLCFGSLNTVAKPETVVPKKTAPEKKAEIKKPVVNLTKLVAAVQKRYNNTKSASFDFEQAYKHPFLPVTENSKGNVSYSRSGGKMLWSYVEPKNRQKKFFIDGNRFTYYSISDKIAYKHNCYNQDTLSASVTFLLGTGNLKESFTISLFDGDSPNPALTWLALVPKEVNSPVKRLILGVTSDAKVVESLVEDPSGGKNHFKFKNFKENPTIAASVFVFTAPKGVMVQPMPNVSCPEPKAKTHPTPALKKAPPGPKVAPPSTNTKKP